MSWILVVLGSFLGSFRSIKTLVSFLPSGSQKKFMLSTFDGKNRFSINLLSVACASMNQTVPPNSASAFVKSSGFDLRKLMSDPLRNTTESAPDLAALIMDNVLNSCSLSASRVNFIATSISIGLNCPASNLASHPAQRTPVLASKEQIGVFN